MHNVDLATLHLLDSTKQRNSNKFSITRLPKMIGKIAVIIVNFNKYQWDEFLFDGIVLMVWLSYELLTRISTAIQTRWFDKHG